MAWSTLGGCAALLLVAFVVAFVHMRRLEYETEGRISPDEERRQVPDALPGFAASGVLATRSWDDAKRLRLSRDVDSDAPAPAVGSESDEPSSLKRVGEKRFVIDVVKVELEEAAPERLARTKLSRCCSSGCSTAHSTRLTRLALDRQRKVRGRRLPKQHKDKTMSMMIVLQCQHTDFGIRRATGGCLATARAAAKRRCCCRRRSLAAP